MAPKAKAEKAEKAVKSPGKAVKPAKEKKEKKEKDPNAPKRPLSGYMYFAKHHREELKKTEPGLSLGEVGKACGAAWSKLDDKAKAPFQKEAEKDKARYEKEKAAYVPQDD